MKTPKQIRALSDAFWARQPYNEDAFAVGYRRAVKDMNSDFEDFFTWVYDNGFKKVSKGWWQKVTNDSSEWPKNFASVTLNQLRNKYEEEKK